MPFYEGKTRIGKRCDCYDADTGNRLDKVLAVDTDKGILVETVLHKDKGNRRLEKRVRKGNFYVVDRVSGERNPESDANPAKSGTWREFVAKNNRPDQRHKYASGAYVGESSMDVLKKEVPNVFEVIPSPRPIEVTPYLNEKAKKLYAEKLGGISYEYILGPNGELEYPTPYFPPGIEAKSLKEYEDWEKAHKDWQRMTGLVRFAVKQVTLREDTVPDHVIERWSKVLNMLADKDIWYFGTLLTNFVLPLHLWGDGTPFLTHPASRMIRAIEADNDPRSYELPEDEKVTPERIKERGQRFLLLAYIGVHPRFSEGSEDTVLARLNEEVGNELFVEEGRPGNNDWTGLPE